MLGGGEHTQRPLSPRQISTCETLLGDEDHLSLLEIAMDPNRSPEALQQDSSTNQKTFHSLSPSAVSPLESRLSSSQLKVSRQDLEAKKRKYDGRRGRESFSKVRKLF